MGFKTQNKRDKVLGTNERQDEHEENHLDESICISLKTKKSRPRYHISSDLVKFLPKHTGAYIFENFEV